MINRIRWAKFCCFVFGISVTVFAAEDFRQSAGGADCTFRANPEEYVSRELRTRSAIFNRVQAFNRAAASIGKGQPRAAVDAKSIPRVNFIDAQIFGKLDSMGVASAPLTTDEEFVRRIYFDLTGRIPSASQVRDFVSDSNPSKRDALIDKLLYSPEFMDKWTMWLGDLTGVSTVSTFNPVTAFGRNSFQGYLQRSIASDKSLRDIVFELVTAKTGDTTDYVQNTDMQDYGPANWIQMANTPGGPQQDTADTLLSHSASMFLGMGHYDCLLCHNGRGHLDAISLWGKNVTRLQAEQMSAFFWRSRAARQGNQNLANYNTWKVYDALSGNYPLGTTYGNRPNRPVVGTMKDVTPVYLTTGAAPALNDDWRAAFASNLVKDPMFARNFANRIWKALFNMGLVDPVDLLDPARLDPKNPPADPWTLQATHPELLEQLAGALTDSNFSLHEFIRTIVSSSAYQLSSRYDGDWNLAYVPLFARHYPRRLEGEEIHDAISIATGVFNKYTVQGWADPVQFAMQLPEPVEPRSNGAAANFMNYFLRGNRDTQTRNQAGSVLQQLALMNDNFVGSRMHVTTSPVLMAISKLPTSDAVTREIWMNFLSRQPNDDELAKATAYLNKATPALRNTYIEDLAWAALNKVEFIFSY